MGRNRKKEHIKEVEICIDTCAQLGGVSYECVQNLKNLYEKAGNFRKLTYVDTHQGYREKSNRTKPGVELGFNAPRSKYGTFIDNNKSWVKIVETKECSKFYRELTERIFPKMVIPFIHATEAAMKKIRKEAFKMAEEEEITHLSGHYLKTHKSVPIKIVPEGTGYNRKKVFADNIVRKAFYKVFKEEWQGILKRNPDIPNIDHVKSRDFLIDSIVTVQRIKAYTYLILDHMNEHQRLKHMGHIPAELGKHKYDGLHAMDKHLHFYGQLKLPYRKDGKLGHSACIQAVKYSEFWPWNLSGRLKRGRNSQDTFSEELKDLHHNCADRSFVDYVFRTMPNQPGYQNRLYIILTHDGPLMEEFIFCYTGVEQEKALECNENGKVIGTVTFDRMTSNKFYTEKGYNRKNIRKSHPPMALNAKEFSEFLTSEIARIQEKQELHSSKHVRAAILKLEESIEKLNNQTPHKSNKSPEKYMNRIRTQERKANEIKHSCFHGLSIETRRV